MVEFLLAIVPIFVFFLGTVQLALAAAAQVVVKHAASVAVRSAVVVLEDDPGRYGGAPRGDLCAGGEWGKNGLSRLLSTATESLGRDVLSTGVADGSRSSSGEPGAGTGRWARVGGVLSNTEAIGCRQGGARMGAIREAVYLPLLPLAPSARGCGADPSVSLALRTSASYQLSFAREYSQAATVVTLHDGETPDDHQPPSSIPRHGLVSARVSYFFRCRVPLVDRLLCATLASLLEREPREVEIQGRLQRRASVAERLPFAERAAHLAELAGEESRFLVLEGEALLPNQGADYVDLGEDQ